MARRTLLPATLALLGAWLLVGCIYVPWGDKVPPGQRDVRPLVGKQKSDRPIRVGSATREDVLRIAGNPNGVASDSRTWFYQWSAENGGWFMPLCFAIEPAWRDYTLSLEFGDDGRLKRFGVQHRVHEFNPLENPGPNSFREVTPATTHTVAPATGG